MRLPRLAVLSLASLLAVGCTDRGPSPTGPRDDGKGDTPRTALQVVYTGLVSGELQVSGLPAWTGDGGMGAGSFAVAFRPTESTLSIAAAEYDGERGNAVSLVLTGTKPGVYGMGEDCHPSAPEEHGHAGCAVGAFHYDVDLNSSSPEDGYAFSRGEVTVDSVTPIHLEGRFWGDAIPRGRVAEEERVAVSFAGGSFSLVFAHIPGQ